MAGYRVDFTQVSRLDAVAVGEPGERTFHIAAESESSSAALWLEKEQLFQLALAIHQLLEAVREGEDAAAASSVDLDLEAPPMTRIDFRAGRLGLRHDDSRGMFIVEAHDLESPDFADDDAPPDIVIWVPRSRILRFADQALEVCAAGRPLCPLCGSPIEPPERGGHRCPRVNGSRAVRSPGLG